MEMRLRSVNQNAQLRDAQARPNRKTKTVCFVSLSFAGLVVLARSFNPIPSRTRPLNSSAPMVLWLKPWESRSLPGLQRTKTPQLRYQIKKRRFLREAAFFVVCTRRPIGANSSSRIIVTAAPTPMLIQRAERRESACVRNSGATDAAAEYYRCR